MVLDSSSTICPLRITASGLKDCRPSLGLINGSSAKATGSGSTAGVTFEEMRAYVSCLTLLDNGPPVSDTDFVCSLVHDS